MKIINLLFLALIISLHFAYQSQCAEAGRAAEPCAAQAGAAQEGKEGEVQISGDISIVAGKAYFFVYRINDKIESSVVHISDLPNATDFDKLFVRIWIKNCSASMQNHLWYRASYAEGHEGLCDAYIPVSFFMNNDGTFKKQGDIVSFNLKLKDKSVKVHFKLAGNSECLREQCKQFIAQENSNWCVVQ